MGGGPNDKKLIRLPTAFVYLCALMVSSRVIPDRMSTAGDKEEKRIGSGRKTSELSTKKLDKPY